MNQKITKTKAESLLKLSKRSELQKVILDSSKNTVLSLNLEQIKSLNLIFGKKKNLSLAIQGVIFTAHKIIKDNDEIEYLLYRKLDSGTNVHDVQFITDIQAKQLGLSENIEKVKIGDRLFNVFYINIDSLPQTSKDFIKKQNAPKVTDDKFIQNNNFYVSAFSQLPSLFETYRDYFDFNDDNEESMMIQSPVTYPKSSIKHDFNDYVDLTDLAAKTPVTAKNILERDEVNFANVQKTGYHLFNPIDLIPTYTFEKRQDVSFVHSPAYKSVSSFIDRLQAHYELPAPQLEDFLSKETDSDAIPAVFKQEIKELDSLDSTHKLLFELEEQSKNFSTELTELNLKIEKVLEETPDEELSSNQYYSFLLESKGKIEFEIKELEKDLKNYHNKFEHITNKYEKLAEKIKLFSFTTVLSTKPDLLAKHKNLLNCHVLDYDAQFNEIQFARLELEEMLIEKIKKLHNFKKNQANFQINDEKKDVNELALQELEKEDRKMAQLEEVGKIYEGSFFIQKKILQEKAELFDYLENLKTFSTIEEHSKTSLKDLQKSQDEALTRKMELDAELKISHEALSIKYNAINAFTESAKDNFADFESKILQIIYDQKTVTLSFINTINKYLVNDLVEKLNEISINKNALLTQVSDVFFAQYNRITVEQGKLDDLISKQQKDWNYVLTEALDEYKKTNFYHPEMQEAFDVEKIDSSFIPEPKFTPSILIKKMMDLDQSFELNDYTVPLISLNPQVKDDKEFLVLSQVFPTLTEEQEEEGRLLLEERQKEAEAAELALKKSEMTTKDTEETEETKKVDKLVDLKEELPSDIKLIFSKKEIDKLKLAEDITFIKSSLNMQFKEEIFSFAKKLIKNKEVSLINTKLLISDTGLGEETEVYTSKDYFKSSKKKTDFSNTEELNDLTQNNHKESEDLYGFSDVDADNIIEKAVTAVEEDNVYNDDFHPITEESISEKVVEEEAKVIVEESISEKVVEEEAKVIVEESISEKVVEEIEATKEDIVETTTSNDFISATELVDQSLNVDTNDMVSQLLGEQFQQINQSTIEKNQIISKLIEEIKNSTQFTDEEKEIKIQELTQHYALDDSSTNFDTETKIEDEDSADEDSTDEESETTEKKSFWKRIFKR